jgi:hypothetical protein
MGAATKSTPWQSMLIEKLADEARDDLKRCARAWFTHDRRSKACSIAALLHDCKFFFVTFFILALTMPA